jgi:hypothetical protein
MTMLNQRLFLPDSEISERAAAPLSTESVGDWMLLRAAVRARLRTCVGEPAASEATIADTLARLRANVLDCVAALDQLDLALTQGLLRFRWSDPEWPHCGNGSGKNGAGSGG